MGIRLVSHVPYETIVRSVVDVMQSDGEFDGAEAGSEVTAHLADGVDQILAQLIGNRAEFGRRNSPQIDRRINACKQRVGGLRHAGQV